MIYSYNMDVYMYDTLCMYVYVFMCIYIYIYLLSFKTHSISQIQHISKCSTLFWNGGIHFQVFGLSRTAGLGYGTDTNVVIAMLGVAVALRVHDVCGQAHGDTGSRGLAEAQRFGPVGC